MALILLDLVPLARLERARPCRQQILNLSRLPIPPQGPNHLSQPVNLLYLSGLLLILAWPFKASTVS